MEFYYTNPHAIRLANCIQRHVAARRTRFVFLHIYFYFYWTRRWRWRTTNVTRWHLWDCTQLHPANKKKRDFQSHNSLFVVAVDVTNDLKLSDRAPVQYWIVHEMDSCLLVCLSNGFLLLYGFRLHFPDHLSRSLSSNTLSSALLRPFVQRYVFGTLQNYTRTYLLVCWHVSPRVHVDHKHQHANPSSTYIKRVAHRFVIVPCRQHFKYLIVIPIAVHNIIVSCVQYAA